MSPSQGSCLGTTAPANPCAFLFGIPEKLDEILAAAEPALRADIVEADSRAATVKQRPTSRRITPAEISVREEGSRGDRAGTSRCDGAECRVGRGFPQDREWGAWGHRAGVRAGGGS